MTDGVRPGSTLLAGRYQIGDLIGRGGMADVHVGIDSRLGRRVAIKLLKPSLASDPSFRVRFRREAQDAAKMAHPTIVRIFDAGEETVVGENGVEVQAPFIIMEHVEGRSLSSIIAEGPLDPSEAIRITEQVLTALEYSHRAGVIHRDIKPANVMVTAGGQVKVMDFGIARAVADSSATIAQTSTIMGTAQYFSPEQARGEAVDARTDLYSTGIMLFEMLTGRAPFVDENPVAVAYQHVNQAVIAPSQVNPRVSPAIDALVLRSVAKDRFNRFQSAAEFREAAAAARAGAVTARRAPGPDDFNTTLYGVNPSVTAGAEATFRQLTVADDDRVVRTQSRPPVAWLWGSVAVMIVIVAAVLVWTLSLSQTNLGANLAATVPDVKNQSFEVGEAEIIKAKLVPERIDVPNDELVEGTIIRTDPPAGAKVRLQQIVKVYVSAGPQQITIPQVIGLNQTDAEAAITTAGFTVGSVTTSHSPSQAAGLVMAQTPSSSETAAKGAKVDLVVSDGLVSVPDVTGKPIGEASSTLQALQLQVTTEADLGCTGGTVSFQSIVGDQAQRSPITIRYCGGV